MKTTFQQRNGHIGYIKMMSSNKDLSFWNDPTSSFRMFQFELFQGCFFRCYTLPETNKSPLKIGHPKRKLVFRCETVSFREGNWNLVSQDSVLSKAFFRHQWPRVAKVEILKKPHVEDARHKRLFGNRGDTLKPVFFPCFCF